MNCPTQSPIDEVWRHSARAVHAGRNGPETCSEAGSYFRLIDFGLESNKEQEQDGETGLKPATQSHELALSETRTLQDRTGHNLTTGAFPTGTPLSPLSGPARNLRHSRVASLEGEKLYSTFDVGPST